MSEMDDLYGRLKDEYQKNPDSIDDPLLRRAFAAQTADIGDTERMYRRMLSSKEQEARDRIDRLVEERSRLTADVNVLKGELAEHQATMAREVMRLEDELEQARGHSLYRLAPDEAEGLERAGWVKSAAD